MTQKEKILEALNQLQTGMELYWKMRHPNGKLPDTFFAGLTNVRNEVFKIKERQINTIWCVRHTKTGDYWSNWFGWVKESFDLYTQREKENNDLPMDGEWKEFYTE